MAEEKTFYQEYEVFSKRTPSSAFQHQFSLLAPNEEMATRFGTRKFHAPRTGCRHLDCESESTLERWMQKRN